MTDISKLLEREVLPVDTTEPTTKEQEEVVDQAQGVFKDLVDGITTIPQNDGIDDSPILH